MRYFITTLLAITAACGTAPKSTVENTDSALNTCAPVAPPYDFHTYGTPSTTPPVPGSGLSWQTQGTVTATGVAFTATLDVDANNAPWFSVKTADGLEQEVCPGFIDVGNSIFSFELEANGWMRVTIVTNGATQTEWST